MKRTISVQHHIQRCLFTPPDIPEDEWCDFRRDYESGMSLLEIGKKYYCDPRTVKTCIIHNKPSAALGAHMCPLKLTPYYEELDRILSSGTFGENENISRITRTLYARICQAGYTGSERTLRNYITKAVSEKKIIRKKELNNDQTYTDRTQKRSEASR